MSQRVKTDELTERGSDVISVAASCASRFMRLGWHRSPAERTTFSKWYSTVKRTAPPVSPLSTSSS